MIPIGRVFVAEFMSSPKIDALTAPGAWQFNVDIFETVTGKTNLPQD
jgi:hypothetical protein